MELDNIIASIIKNLLFLRLKEVVENNGYHHHEKVYDHLIKTKAIAKREISADFITNPEAKELFFEFVNEDFHGMKRADIMILIALLHDVGKILSVKDGNNLHPILVANSSRITSLPGHEYWGSTIVEKFLKEFTLDPQILRYISNVIRLHDTFSENYWAPRNDWPMEAILNDVKSRAEGLYKEALFNIYCDCFTAAPFQTAKEKIVQIFNEPALYTKREYVIT